MSDLMDRKSIDGPEDLKLLSFEELRELAREVRRLILEVTARNGGHLSSSLGAVELTIALHRCFDSPHDQIVWDVGHQAYAHKILTGRRERFATLRQKGGVSGFPRQSESEHDSFIGGHGGISVSAAYGLLKAKLLQKQSGYVAAVVGDGAFGSGMIYEALNNAGRNGSNLIVVLNDNEMSISHSVGAMSEYFTRIRNMPGYYNLKDSTEKALRGIPIAGDRLADIAATSKSFLKDAIYHSSFFERLGFTYLGPVDGHDIKTMSEVFERAKKVNTPVLVHVRTKKGKGYSLAEKAPEKFHGIAGFDLKSGEIKHAGGQTYSQIFGEELVAAAKKDAKIIAITAAMCGSTGLDEFAGLFPKRFFDVGICEEHAVSFAGGLAANGMLPVVAIYSTFLQRAYDQILHDISIERQHVVFAIDRAGVVGEDGATHQGLFDVSMLSNIPGMAIYSPSDFFELKTMLHKALYEETGPVAVRYPRGTEESQPFTRHTGEDVIKYEAVARGAVLIVGYGREFCEIERAYQKLSEEDRQAVSLLKLGKICPVDDSAVAFTASHQKVLFFEEAVERGSVGETFGCALMKRGFRGSYFHRAVEGFVQHATVEESLKLLRLDADSVVEDVRAAVNLWRFSQGAANAASSYFGGEA